MSSKKVIMEFDDKRTTISLFERAVINKNLKDYIRSVVEENFEVAVSLESMFDNEVRSNVVFAISRLLNELLINKVIDQWDIISDRRNNTAEDRKNGVLNFTIKFRQWNCLKATQLEYVITTKRQKNIKRKKGRRVIL